MGLSKGKLRSLGATNNEYLVRAKKGQRTRMLVLQMDAVHRFMKEEVK